MKFVALLLLCATSALADYQEIDWSNVVRVEDLPGFWDGKPEFLRPTGKVLNVRNPRIVNGEIATPHQFPYQAGLFSNFPDGFGLCGGALIHPRNVLTAAHCIYMPPTMVASEVQVVLGAHFLQQNEPTQQRRVVPAAQFVIHPDWNPNFIYSDIAILVLPTAVTLNNAVAVIALPQNNVNQFADAQAAVSGWGWFQDRNREASEVLRFYRGTILPQANCRLRFPGVIQASNICLSGANNGGACRGDSGGPLTTVAEGVHTHIGVVSFGLALGCERTWPSVFARTSFFLPWIRTNMAN